jgi:hypothetical protein
MAKFRKKPVEIEAFRLGYDNYPSWFLNNPTVHINDRSALAIQADIKTMEGTMTANHGDWIIKGVKGELYPCKPDIFAATYDAVDVTRKVRSWAYW